MVYDCAGCHTPIDEGGDVVTWATTPLGVTAVHTHEGCEDAGLANISEQPAVRCPAPMTASEKRRARA